MTRSLEKGSLATAFALLDACTAGGVSSATGGGGGTVINVNLTLNAPVPTAYGQSGGYAPPVTTLPVGSQIRFMNTDSQGITHTATLIPNVATFPIGYVFPNSAVIQRGTSLSGGFSSGAMPSGASSQLIQVDRAGTYLFGCFYHYNAPMRGAIVAQ